MKRAPVVREITLAEGMTGSAALSTGVNSYKSE